MEEKRPQFGNRFLTNPRDVFEHNAWDNVEWGEEQEDDARKKVDENSSKAVPEEMREKYESEAGSFWDQFYNQHQNRFFKDRHWLFTEFPELAPADYVPPEKEERPGSSQPSSSANPPEPSSSSKTLADNQRVLVQGIQGEPEEFSPEKAKRALEEAMASAGLSDQDKKERVCQGIQGPIPGEPVSKAADTFPGEKSTMRLFEVGCGVGNTVFPVLETNNDPNLFVYCCDLSDTAIQLVKEHSEYRNGERCHAFVADVTELDQPFPFPKQSLDIVILIFVLSAIHPDKMQATISRLAEYLKPGGMIVFRDYGRYDLAQLRFKNGKCLSPNFYVRGDGTRVYFFTQEELRTLFCSAGLTEEVQNHVDRRLQVNRGRQLKMYRVWVQCKYRKPANSGANS